MPPKNLQLTIAWMVLATLLMGVAAWQAQVTVAKEAAARHATLPPPAKTRHAIRPPATFNGNVVEDYIARCTRGITDREIGWILEDFRNAEIDVDWRDSRLPEQRFRQLVGNQQRWYADSLEDALRLDPAQKRKAREHLAKYFNAAEETLFPERRKTVAPGSGPIPTQGISASLPAHHETQLSEPPLMPWMLCDLTPEQERITWKRWFQSMKEKGVVDPEHENASKPAELTGAPEFRFSEPGSPTSENSSAPGWAVSPDLILPLLKQQELVDQQQDIDPFAESPAPVPEELLGNIRRLHPAQLKLLLFFEPEMAAQLEKELQGTSR